MNRKQVEAALYQARAVVAQLEAALDSVQPEAPPPDPGHFCPGCKSRHVDQIDKAPEDLWRIRCRDCKSVWVEPAPKETVQ